jgi:hypothetical protein
MKKQSGDPPVYTSPMDRWRRSRWKGSWERQRAHGSHPNFESTSISLPEAIAIEQKQGASVQQKLLPPRYPAARSLRTMLSRLARSVMLRVATPNRLASRAAVTMSSVPVSIHQFAVADAATYSASIRAQASALLKFVPGSF